MAVMKEREKKSGVVVIDIGGGTTEVAIYIDGAIRYSEVIKVAANDVTHDIAHGVKALYEVAEELKIKHGCAYGKLSGEDEELLIEGIEGRPQKSVPKSSLTMIIEARMMEILELVRDSVKRSGYYEYLNAGAIITGGGSLLPGAEELARDVLGLDIRIGYPEGVSGGIKGSVNNPMYATVMGLVAHAFQNNLSVNHSFASTAEVLPTETPVGIQEESVVQEQSPAGKKIVDRMKKFWDNL